jgi:hypothetical protein
MRKAISRRWEARPAPAPPDSIVIAGNGGNLRPLAAERGRSIVLDLELR